MNWSWAWTLPTSLARNFEETIKLAQAYNLCRAGEEAAQIGDRSAGQAGQILPRTLTPLLNVQQEYGDVLNDLIGQLLAKLISQHPARFLLKFDQYPLVVKLLNDSAAVVAVREQSCIFSQTDTIDRLLRRTDSHRLWYETTCIAKNGRLMLFH